MSEKHFELVSDYQPAGDQPQAIEKLIERIENKCPHQTLLGVTGSGKTFTIANVIEKIGRPTLVISHNKTLAAQLYAEFKGFFPNNAVEYFVSYFDYYQPEAYIPRTDTFIEKDSSINEEIERLRMSTTSSLLSRSDVIVVASVSCIYGLGSKEDYEAMMITLKTGEELARESILEKLVDLQYTRNDVQFKRGQFRVRGDTLEIAPSYREDAVRVELFGDEIERLTRFDPLTGNVLEDLQTALIYPAKQFVTPQEKIKQAVLSIREELGDRIAWFEKRAKLLEAQRVKMRTEYDLEMMIEMGYCSGIENYSRHLSGRPPGSVPYTLMGFFPDDYLLVIDESHATLPQVRGMFAGDHSRKNVLVEHGFRLPSALDNRPLNFEEFQTFQFQSIYVSATPGPLELEWSGKQIVEQIVRPTGLIDPTVTIKPLKGQIDNLIHEAKLVVDEGERVLVTTLTKRTAEELTDYLRDVGINVRYLHSEIDTIERVEILRALRKGDFDVLVGINLLREGLDIPEVSLVAILDADKEGFLRSTTSLTQTAGRASRHVKGRVILYADNMTRSIKEFLKNSEYRRRKQIEYNKEHGITPKSVSRAIEDRLSPHQQGLQKRSSVLKESGQDFDIVETLKQLEEDMLEAAQNLEFEKAALMRDQIKELKIMSGAEETTGNLSKAKSSRSKPDPSSHRKRGKTSGNRSKKKT